MTGGGPRATSLEQSAQNFNSKVIGAFNPTSVLDAYQIPEFHPQNGNSPADVQRQTPGGQIPTLNGISQTTYDALNPSTYRTRLEANG